MAPGFFAVKRLLKPTMLTVAISLMVRFRREDRDDKVSYGLDWIPVDEDVAWA
jgi:hypothetical protein